MKSVKLSNSTRRFFVDDEDFDRVNAQNWCLRKKDIASKINGEEITIGRFIKELGVGNSIIVDHEDRDIFNNQKINLRFANYSQNGANKSIKPRINSPFKGIYWYEGKWRARIKANNITYHLGSFTDPIAAAKAYNRAAKEYFGEFAVLNKFNEDTAIVDFPEHLVLQ